MRGGLQLDQAAPEATGRVPAPHNASNSSRLKSLDTLRGVTVAAMILVNTSGDGAHTYPILAHSPWNGCTLADVVFPCFLFMVGISSVFSLSGRLRAGTPHPVLAQNYRCELLNVQPFPAFGGNSSRLLGESWDSTNLYWARLADEKGYSPIMMNRLVPELTRHMVANIFATDIEDWPALTRAMRETGEEFRQGKIAVQQITEASSATRENGVQGESEISSAAGGHK